MYSPIKVAMLVVLALVCWLQPISSSQASSAGSQEKSNAKTKVVPAAPPPVSKLTAIPQDCFVYSMRLNPLNNMPVGPAQATVFGTASYSVKYDNGVAVLSCAGDTAHVYDGAGNALQGRVQFPPPVEVWTAADSQSRFDFLRAEILSTINSTVSNSVVNKVEVQQAIDQAIQAKFTEAFNAALDTRIAAIRADLKAEIIKEIQAGAKPATTSARPKK